MIAFDDKDGSSINLVFTGRDGEAGQAAFEQAIVTLKKELPEGYRLVEQKYDAANGTMTFKVTAPEGQKTDETIVKKLVETIKNAIKN